MSDKNAKENQNSYHLDKNTSLISKNTNKDSNKIQCKLSKLKNSDKNNDKQNHNFILNEYKIDDEFNKENDLNHPNIICKNEINKISLTKSIINIDKNFNSLQSLSDKNFENSKFNIVGDYIINTDNFNKKLDYYKTDKKILKESLKDLNFYRIKTKKSKRFLHGLKIGITQENEPVNLNKSFHNDKEDNNIYKKTINDCNNFVELKRDLEKINTNSYFKNKKNLNQLLMENTIINNFTDKNSKNFVIEKDAHNKLSPNNFSYINELSQNNITFNKDCYLGNNKEKSFKNNKGELSSLDLENYFSYSKLKNDKNKENKIKKKFQIKNKNKFKNKFKNKNINIFADKKTENLEDCNNKIHYNIEDFNKNRNLITMKEEFIYSDKNDVRKEESEIIKNLNQKPYNQIFDSESHKINLQQLEEFNNYGTLENNNLPKVYIKPKNKNIISFNNHKSISEKILFDKNKLLNFKENNKYINFNKDLNINKFEEGSKETHKLYSRFSQSYEVYRPKYIDILTNKKSYYFGNNSTNILLKNSHNCINKSSYDFKNNNLKISNKNISLKKSNKLLSSNNNKNNLNLNYDNLIKGIEMNTIKMNKDSQNTNLSIKGIEKEIKDEKTITCRICLESNIIQATTDEEDKYISPCLCHGTMKYVHESCLKKWIPNQVKKLSKAECEICKCSYKLKFETKKIYSSEKMCVFLEKFFTFIGIICLLLFIIDFVIYSIVVNIVRFNTQEKDTFTLILSLSGVGDLLIIIALILRNYKKHVYEIYPIGWTILEHDSNDEYEKNVTYELFRKLDIELENHNRSNIENINFIIENNNNEENNQINFNNININYHINQNNNLPSNMNFNDIINENIDFNNNLNENLNRNTNDNGNIDIINVQNEEIIKIKSNDILNDLINQKNNNIINNVKKQNLYNKGITTVENENKLENINNCDIQISEIQKD